MLVSTFIEFSLNFESLKFRRAVLTFTALHVESRITMRCTGAATPSGLKWTIIRRRPVNADVELNRSAEEFVG